MSRHSAESNSRRTLDDPWIFVIVRVMPPNWLVQWLPIIESFLKTVAVLGGAVIALMGLNTWRRQLRGQTDYELAQRLMRAVYRVRKEIQLARDPCIMPAETDTAVKEVGLGEFEKGDQVKQSEAVYSMRFHRVATQWVELEAEILEAEVIWGSEWVGVIDDLEVCVKELRSAFRRFALQKERPGYSSERINEIDEIVYSYKEKARDKFAQKVDAAVKKFEAVARPHLGHRQQKLRKWSVHLANKHS